MKIKQLKNEQRSDIVMNIKETYKAANELSYDNFLTQITGEENVLLAEQIANVLSISQFSIEEIRAKNRNQYVTAARHALAYLLSVNYSDNLKEVGRLIKRDRTTVSYAVERWNDCTALTDPELWKYKAYYVQQVKVELCDVCGSDDIKEAPGMGRNCNRCHPI
jgi:D-Tyr-tRNAtyr deacylase